ncbi:hypothetical protein E4K72_23185 [Oxalobacteraceae bacterium OM1]|nr:hypothetical protein E4K72_23185 [Oxalobacteraceae bacterium OM1]
MPFAGRRWLALPDHHKEAVMVIFSIARFRGVVAVAVAAGGLHAAPWAQSAGTEACPRPMPGSAVTDPPELAKAGDGAFHLTARNSGTGPEDRDAPAYAYRFCLRGNDDARLQAPVLRMSAGETVRVALSNRLQAKTGFPETHVMTAPGTSLCVPQPDGLAGGNNLTNLHYHGLNIPPRCGGDETINTVLAAPQTGGTADYTYQFTIPANEPPGLYWYHPHMHGVSQQQILGGMSGIIVIDGMEKLFPEVGHLTERILVLRDQDKPNPADREDAPQDEPWKDVSINYVPVTWNGKASAAPQPAPQLSVGAGERQFWRVANAAADTAFVLKLQYRFSSAGPWQDQPLELLAFDGVPQVDDSGMPGARSMTVTRIVLPPAGRAEFIMAGPPAGAEARLYSDDYNRYLASTNPKADATDATDRQPARVLADIHSAPAGRQKAAVPRQAAEERVKRFMNLRQSSTLRNRSFFFTKDPADEGNFFLTPEGRTPKPFDMAAPPDVTVNMPTVEDWTIENRDSESHVFHIHQIHFRVLEVNGVPTDDRAEPTLRDTIELPACRDWGSADPEALYQGDPAFVGKNCREPFRVKLRMDFREQDIAGTSLFHCHILEHQDKGMMAKMELAWNPQAAREEARILREQGSMALERSAPAIEPGAQSVVPALMRTVSRLLGERVAAVPDDAICRTATAEAADGKR